MISRKKRFLSFYKTYRGLFAADILCALLATGCALLLPLGAGYVTQNILEGDFTHALERILWTGLVLLGLIVLQGGCAYFMDYQGHAMGAMMERDVRKTLFSHCQKLSFSYYDRHNVGELMSRITGDSLSLTEFFHHFPEDLAVNSMKSLGASFILLTINWQLTLCILALLPLMALYTLHFNKKMAKALKESRENMSDVNAQVQDSLSGIRVVQSFSNEEVEEKKFGIHNERFLHSRKVGYRSEAVCFGGADAFAQLIPIAVVVLGGIAILDGSLHLSQLVVFLLYVNFFTAPIQSLIHMTQQFQEGMTSFRRFCEVMELEPEIQENPKARPLSQFQGKITFSHVDFQYDTGEPVLTDLSLTIHAGDYVALVGPSGVGKTTLCSLIPRFYQATAGTIAIDGTPVEEITLHSLRKAVGVVQQSVYLFSGTVAENIAYGRPGCSKEELISAAKKAGAHDFITSLPQGYETDIGPHGVRLSGGQQQRLSIARAFLKDPAILILDEATSSLDNQSEELVRASLEQLAKNRTTLVIAHRLSTIRNAKRILVLGDTGICEEATSTPTASAHEILLAKGGFYEKLYSKEL